MATTKSGSNFALIAIVAIVAIVALVVMMKPRYGQASTVVQIPQQGAYQNQYPTAPQFSSEYPTVSQPSSSMTVYGGTSEACHETPNGDGTSICEGSCGPYAKCGKTKTNSCGCL